MDQRPLNGGRSPENDADAVTGKRRQPALPAPRKRERPSEVTQEDILASKKAIARLLESQRTDAVSS